MNAEHRYVLHVSKAQARLIERACDLLSRIHMGQLDRVADHLPPIWRGDAGYIRRHHECEALLEHVKGIAFPELVRNAYHGIHSPKIPDEARAAWDLQQVIRHVLAWEEHPEGHLGRVDFDEPRRSSAEEPLATFAALPAPPEPGEGGTER